MQAWGAKGGPWLTLVWPMSVPPPLVEPMGHSACSHLDAGQPWTTRGEKVQIEFKFNSNISRLLHT